MKQVSLFERKLKKLWPAQERFPLNTDQGSIEEILREDILASGRFTIITGYSSLEHLIAFFGTEMFPNRIIKIVLGHELDLPEKELTTAWPRINLAQELRNYWLSQGISITLSGALINFLTELKEDRLHFYLGEKLHAKIYLGETHAILGSSNFSRAGLKFQKEANCRFAKDDPRYAEVALIVENFLRESRDYQREIIALLEELLRPTTWQEALCWAILKILEDNWLKEYEGLSQVLNNLKLWPSQRQAIAQALWVIDEHGSVLIADPTGAGKTKVGIGLLAVLQARFLLRQEYHKAKSLIICPPGVRDFWEEEASYEGFSFPVETVSHGLLSVAHGEGARRALARMRQAGILLIDEAHNYLSRSSRRSQAVQLNSQAEHVILMTATPLNRGVEDLLRLMEVLGLDNLSDEAINAYLEIRRELERGKRLSAEQFRRLKRYVQVFTVRRTREELNRLIEKEKEAYTDRFGRPCRFPREKSILYATGETEKDRQIALEIEKLARNLVGFIWLKKTLEDLWQEKSPFDPAQLNPRLTAASALALFNVKAMLRSSRAALIEHLEGTEAALKEFNIKAKFKDPTGDLIARLKGMKNQFEERFRPLPSEEAPEFLREKRGFLEALEREIETYQEITALCRKLSPAREEAKVKLIKSLFGRHELILAYDSRLITLAYFEKLLGEKFPEITTIFVTGGRPKERRLLKKLFCLGSPAKGVVALCSDALSEGVNLQQASAVVFFDLPSVIRIAEQRIGRIERLDSPHEVVEVYWPDDSPEFCVSTDKRLVERHLMVENILGSNISIPKEFLKIVPGWQEERISGELMLELYEREKERAEKSFRDELADVFKPVKDLVYGKEPLVPEEVLDLLKGVPDKTALISAVAAESPWCFLCVRGSENEVLAPRWIFVEEGKSPLTDMQLICARLREKLKDDPPPLAWTRQADEALASFLYQIKRAEFDLLPMKSRRALLLLKDVLEFYLKKESKDEGRRKVLAQLKSVLDDYAQENLDLRQLARKWLETISPILKELAQDPRRKTPPLLKDVRRYLRKHPLETEAFARLLKEVRTVTPLEKRIFSCILGLKQK